MFWAVDLGLDGPRFGWSLSLLRRHWCLIGNTVVDIHTSLSTLKFIKSISSSIKFQELYYIS
jgi:hypothetical protein